MTDPKKLADLLQTALDDSLGKTPYVRLTAIFAKELEMVLRSVAQPEGAAISLLRAWVAGCGDERFSTKEQCRELLQRSGDYLASLEPQVKADGN